MPYQLKYALTCSCYIRLHTCCQRKSKIKCLTRRFLNHESRLLSRSHTCAIIVILDLTPYLLRWEKGHWPLDDLWPQGCWGHMCDSIQGSLCIRPMKIHQSMWIQWPFLQNTWTKGHWPLDDLWPQICWGHMCDSTQGSLCPSPMKIHKSMWIQWPFLQKLEPKVIDP